MTFLPGPDDFTLGQVVGYAETKGGPWTCYIAGPIPAFLHAQFPRRLGVTIPPDGIFDLGDLRLVQLYRCPWRYGDVVAEPGFRAMGLWLLFCLWDLEVSALAFFYRRGWVRGAVDGEYMTWGRVWTWLREVVR